MHSPVPTRLEALRKWRCGLVLGACLLGLGAAPAQTAVITNVAGVRALSADEVAEKRPVKLRGVVIDRADPVNRAVVLADDTGGLYALANNNLFARSRPGELIEITGVTDPGEFAPIVKVTASRSLGTAPLPEPQPATYHELSSGVMDSQWVEISGVVQRYFTETGGSDIRRLILSLDGGQIHIRLNDPRNPALQEDAEVRLRALCFYQANPKRQVLSPVLVVPRNIPIIVEKPAPTDPFAAPVRSASSLLQFSVEMHSGHRVHVRGVVTHNSGDTTVWLRDASSGLRLQTRERESAQPGDVIDVLGFPKFGGATPILEECSLRKAGRTNPPTAITLTKPAAAFEHEDDLISLEAMLVDVAPVVEGAALTLKASNTVFKAVLRLAGPRAQALDWKPGSRVRVTGICSVTYDDTRPLMGLWHPQSFQLLLRSPTDLAVLEAPSWWTFEHVTYLFALASLALLGGLGVVAMLARRRLREQAQHRAMAEAEFAAILNERNRVAREIHDTLAQGLTATSFQLRLAKKHAAEASPELNQHLDSAQELVRGSLTEARDTIWNMRSQVLETGDLATALKSILAQMVDGSERKTEFNVTGKPRRLAPVMENNLLRVGQECITNAVRHANASLISVALDFGEKQFRLVVRDNGCGFDAANPPLTRGGFGLVGMRERAHELHGEFAVQSSPGKGTEITLTAPLSA